MKIIHVIDFFQPKLGYQETFLAREHAHAGHDVCIVTSDRYNPIVYSGDAAKSVLGKRVVGAGYFVEEGIQVWRLKTLFEVPHAIWMRGLESKIQELKPDVIIAHGIVSFFAIRIARLRSKTSFKLIYDDHMTFVNSLSKMRILYPLFKWTFSPLIQKAADALVAILPDSKAFMHEKYGIPLERIVIIPLGADDELFRFDSVARQQVRSKLAIDEGDIVFVYAGKIIPEKCVPILVEAGAKLMAGHNNIKVMLVGGGMQSYIDKLKRDIETKSLGGRFVWHEAVPNEQLYRIYSAADVAVWPIGASISMREAMACGLPIIVSEDSGVTELVDYHNGLKFSGGDAIDLARQMERLLDPELRREMGEKSRRATEEKFNWKMISRQFLSLVEK